MIRVQLSPFVCEYVINLNTNSPCDNGVTLWAEALHWSCLQRYFTDKGLNFLGRVFFVCLGSLFVFSAHSSFR